MKPRTRPFDIRARLWAVGGFLGLAGLALVARAVDLQLLNNDFYQQQGDARFLREIPIPVSRGTIFDRNGEPLAISSPVESIWANPKELLAHPDRLPQLAGALNMPLEPLTQRIAQRADREFVYLRRHMNPDQAERIIDLGIPGVYSQREFRRFYPLGEVMAHVLGFTNIDDRGQEGLELAFDDWLTGKPGAKRVIRDRRGRIVENVDLVRAAEPGRDLVLSLDRRIQYLAYRELKAALLEHRAAAGSVVILDVPTGEVLAMVNAPSYNPNARESAEPGSQRNRAVTDVFEPGSVIKAFTVAAALESGKFTPASSFDTSPGYMPLARHVIRDVRNFGVVDMTRLLTKSSNIASTKIALELSNEQFYEVLRKFGFGDATGAGFPGESSGVLPTPRSWGILEKATISYGYGLSMTPLQIAQAYAALGNAGVLMPPTFVKGARAPGRQAVSPQVARTVVGMLETVTGPEGTAQRARVQGYRVAGKSGTSRKASVGGYQKRYLSLFAGLVPASNPRLAMVVIIDDPQGRDYYGGLVAAPVFARVMDGALRLLDVPPDQAEQWYVALPPAPPPEMSAELPADIEPLPEFVGGAGPE
ncbi:MAG: peptidoglycan D,D-transpeptidase FtsI family protein [Rehaibacterium terrae]|uniref:peptidoglycan D,D-transpeptidase FtsI family protein n=1 Tax=Rehaibacterium terrae TaxID=1341696 RepID=UPI00391A730F